MFKSLGVPIAAADNSFDREGAASRIGSFTMCCFKILIAAWTAMGGSFAPDTAIITGNASTTTPKTLTAARSAANKLSRWSALDCITVYRDLWLRFPCVIVVGVLSVRAVVFGRTGCESFIGYAIFSGGVHPASQVLSPERTGRFVVTFRAIQSWNMETVYEAAGGRDGLLKLASAWHTRVLEDEVVSHAFGHGFHPAHRAP